MNKDDKQVKEENPMNPNLYALSFVSGKWKMSLLNHINYYGSIRFSQTKKTFPVSEKVLAQQLKELVADGLVERIQYNEIPLRVEYRLTEIGKTIIPSLDLLYAWGIVKMKERDIPIDPDAFVVHPEKKYEKLFPYMIEHHDEIVALMECIYDHGFDIMKVRQAMTLSRIPGVSDQDE